METCLAIILRAVRCAESIVRGALQAPTITETMVDLFGSSEQTQILLKERAQILSAALSAIKKDRAAFKTLVKEAVRIKNAGNKLADKENAQRATEDAELLANLQATARRKGPVADALAVAAKHLHEGHSLRSSLEDFLGALRGKTSVPDGSSTKNPEHGHQAELRLKHEPKTRTEERPTSAKPSAQQSGPSRTEQGMGGEKDGSSSEVKVPDKEEVSKPADLVTEKPNLNRNPKAEKVEELLPKV